MKRFTLATMVTLAVTLSAATAHAQATRTWVSGVGDDANPCSRTAPCKTFAGAISKTATGGEISVLDPGGYGAVTIIKPITISGVGEQASILASAVQGVIINITTLPTPPQTNTVTLRNIQINGGTGTALGINGVHVFGATNVILDNVNIFGFSTNGVLAEDTSMVTIANSTIFNVSGIAVHSIDTATISVLDSKLVGNNIAVQSDLGATIRLSNNDVMNNNTGFACGTGGVLATAGNNRKAGNAGGVVPVCNPNATVTVQ